MAEYRCTEKDEHGARCTLGAEHATRRHGPIEGHVFEQTAAGTIVTEATDISALAATPEEFGPPIQHHPMHTSEPLPIAGWEVADYGSEQAGHDYCVVTTAKGLTKAEALRLLAVVEEAMQMWHAFNDFPQSLATGTPASTEEGMLSRDV